MTRRSNVLLDCFGLAVFFLCCRAASSRQMLMCSLLLDLLQSTAVKRSINWLQELARASHKQRKAPTQSCVSAVAQPHLQSYSRRITSLCRAGDAHHRCFSLSPALSYRHSVTELALPAVYFPPLLLFVSLLPSKSPNLPGERWDIIVNSISSQWELYLLVKRRRQAQICLNSCHDEEDGRSRSNGFSVIKSVSFQHPVMWPWFRKQQSNLHRALFTVEDLTGSCHGGYVFSQQFHQQPLQYHGKRWRQDSNENKDQKDFGDNEFMPKCRNENCCFYIL